MAKFKAELPIDIIQSFEKLESSCQEMIGEMTKAGAKTVYKKAVVNMRKSFKHSADLEKCLKITKTYKTPSDGGVNTKIGIYGYLRGDKSKPAPLIANSREHGNSRGEKRKPFFKKSFVKSDIEREMTRVQDKYLPKG